MKHLVYKIIVASLAGIKIVASVMILLFPMQLMDHLYPFAFFSPLLTAAVAYADVSKWLLLLMLGIGAVLLLSIPVCTVLLFLQKKAIRFCATLLQVAFCLEALCLCPSLFFGSLAIGKLIGIAFNLTAVFLLSKLKAPESL